MAFKKKKIIKKKKQTLIYNEKEANNREVCVYLSTLRLFLDTLLFHTSNKAILK